MLNKTHTMYSHFTLPLVPHYHKSKACIHYNPLKDNVTSENDD